MVGGGGLALLKPSRVSVRRDLWAVVADLAEDNTRPLPGNQTKGSLAQGEHIDGCTSRTHLRQAGSDDAVEEAAGMAEGAVPNHGGRPFPPGLPHSTIHHTARPNLHLPHCPLPLCSSVAHPVSPPTSTTTESIAVHRWHHQNARTHTSAKCRRLRAVQHLRSASPSRGSARHTGCTASDRRLVQNLVSRDGASSQAISTGTAVWIAHLQRAAKSVGNTEQCTFVPRARSSLVLSDKRAVGRGV